MVTLAFKPFPLWAKVLGIALLPVVALNASVSFLGQSETPILSVFFLREKAQAIGAYTRHRVSCFWNGHPDIDTVVSAVEREHHLPSGLLVALISVESNAQPHRISPAGAMGPAQLMPATAALLKVDDPFETRTSVAGAARYLSELLREKQKVELAVASYNAGPGAVGGSIPQNGETEVYVRRVMESFKQEKQRQNQQRPHRR